MTSRVLHWFRRDLRVADNTALLAGAQRATDGVVGVYVISPGEWEAHDDSPVKVEFWRRNLVALSDGLWDRGIPLLIRSAATPSEIPGLLARTAAETGADTLTFNHEYELNESRLGAAVVRRFEREGRSAIARHDRRLLAPGSVLTGAGAPFTVFTPFQNRLMAILDGAVPTPAGAPPAQRATGLERDRVPEAFPGGDTPIDPGLWPAGEASARRRLDAFLADRVGVYGDRRDALAEDGTSALSPYLAAGVLSVRQCVRAAADVDGGVMRVGKAFKGVATGPGKWISELIWRDFYQDLLFHFPRLSMGVALRPIDRKVPWRESASDFEAWREGRTGYPVVDAAMRQLAATGWMHNRARMIVAMFLTKHLLIDWRRGERHFMRSLIDGDLGSNNGGWQWSASTGADAAPYFRIYNPTAQGQRHDPAGAYVRRWVPELGGLDGAAIHDPARLSELHRAELDYPDPIVEHGAARARALEVFKAAGQPDAGQTV